METKHYLAVGYICIFMAFFISIFNISTALAATEENPQGNYYVSCVNKLYTNHL